MPDHHDYDDKLAEKDPGAYRRYRLLRNVHRQPGGRNKLRAIRRAAASSKPRDARTRRPSLALFLLFGLVLAALVLVERAEGGIRCSNRPTDRQLAIVGALVLVLAVFAVIVDASAASRRGTKAQICEVFGARCSAALRVASCETGGTFYPRSVGSAGERGVFQIHPIHFGWLDETRLWSPAYNARAAYKLSRGGRDWSHWSCRP